MYSIGQLSRRTGVKVPTIRYYEQTGLMPEPERTAGNQRRYGEEGLERLAFIRHARDLGLSISAIRDLIELSGEAGTPCTRAHEIASAHLTDVRQRIEQLQRLERELSRIAASCDSGTVGECMVLTAITRHDMCAGEH